MSSNNGLMRLFWPSDAPSGSHPGVLVGWKNSELDFLVVAILQDVEARSVDNALRVGNLYRNCPHPITQLLERCGNLPLQVLGTVNDPSVPTKFDANSIVVYTAEPKAPRVYCPNTYDLTIQVVIFDRPNPTRMQYLSLTPMSLALGDKVLQPDQGDLPEDSIEAGEERERARKARLVEKLKLHTVISHPPTRKELSFPRIIEQINCSYELNALMQKNIGLVGTRLKRTLSVSERVVESATDLWDYISMSLHYIVAVWLYPLASQLFVFGLMAHRMMGEVIMRVLEWRASPTAAAIKDISATAQQVDIRLQQFCYWPIQYLTLRKSKSTWGSITNSHPEYIRFYNSLWLVANDVIIGIALGSYVIENSHFVAAQVDTVFHAWSIDGLRRMIRWLMGWPGGLKLNNELAEFLGDLFIWVIDHWADRIASLRPFLPEAVNFIGFSSFAGATMPISLFSDLVSVLTLHIYCFYVASARIANWQITIIGSLFNLFRGKKRNVLRHRIDNCDYDLDQLLLGTILFTLLVFLAPTVFVFYLTFASARMAIISLKALLDTLLACLNHFPLFALMLRIKDSRRLPGGIRFELQIPSPSKNTKDILNTAPTAHIHLYSLPLPLHLMFNEYFALGNRIRKHYLSLSVIIRLAHGEFVPPIHRKNLYSLQYSMLPARRKGIWELWEALKASDEDQRGTRENGSSRPVLKGRRSNYGKGKTANGTVTPSGKSTGALGKVRQFEVG